MSLPETEHLRLSLSAGVLTVLFDRPQVRNAMSVQTVSELEATFESVAERRDVRAVVLRGSGGHFCAGGDIKDMASARGKAPSVDGKDALAVVNRRFGSMITLVDRAPQAVVAVCEGAVLGGGFGLACVADVTLALAGAKFGLPETGLGIPPAQIAPFLVQRLGLSQARRLAVTGGRFDGHRAVAIGLAHEVAEDAAGLEVLLTRTLKQVLRCAPGAVALTKELMNNVGTLEHEALLDGAADSFAAAARGAEGIEGMAAFMQKREPSWPGGEA
ncbi:MAG: enoyl-CoA hydratase/isomerase family protein [Nannocystaceae bacterium]|nr:enoyl-CoA hydratase/isomerase family protein [Nannocystaceae bacterium]